MNKIKKEYTMENLIQNLKELVNKLEITITNLERENEVPIELTEEIIEEPIQRPPTKKALLVGINKYQIPGNDLNGCVNDVENMYNLLRNTYNFYGDNIRVLTDERATKANILERLDWLIKDSVPGDHLLFQFSGHGSQIRDRNGDELSDGLDEILCPHDMNWDDPLSDDVLKPYFQKVNSEAKLVFFCDSWHSGTIMDLTERRNLNSRQLDKHENSRFLTPPFDIKSRSIKRKNIKRRQIGVKKGITYTNEQNHILLAGCQENQYSSDAKIDGQWQGAFTYSLIKTLTNMYNRKWINIAKFVHRTLKSNGFEQVPQILVTKNNAHVRIFDLDN